ncbi:hypothetical protein CBL_20631 [Carabus blaptoides fortunei]
MSPQKFTLPAYISPVPRFSPHDPGLRRRAPGSDLIAGDAVLLEISFAPRGNKAYIIDVTVAFENKPEAFQAARQRKIDKYTPLARAMELRYPNINQNVEPPWIGTVGPYLNFARAFGLRLKELRLGHAQMPIEKKDGKNYCAQVKSYGLRGMHHILLKVYATKQATIQRQVGGCREEINVNDNVY